MRLTKKLIVSVLCAGMMLHTQIGLVQQEISARVGRNDPVLLKLSGSGTLDIYADESLTNAITYISKSGNYAGDMALLEESDNAYKVRIAGYTGWVRKQSGLTPLTMSEIVSPSYYAVNSSHELYHRISTNPTGTTYSTTPVLGPAPDYLETGVNYYSYDGIYFYEDYLDMINDYVSNTTRRAVNDGEPYYNYYLYLPFHTESNYDGDDLNEYMEDTLNWTDVPDSYPASQHESMLYGEGDTFFEIQDEYGTNALLIFAIAMNESAGRSEYAVERNNLFGLGAVDANPDSANDYDSIAECIEQFATYHINWGYLDYYDSRYFGGHVGNKASGINVKYASDPYWGEKAAMYYYRVDKALGMEDYESYTIGIHESDDAYSLLKEARRSSSVIARINTVPLMPYAILDEEDGFYRVTTDFHLTEDRSILRHDDSLWYLPFDYDNNYAFIEASELYVNGEVPSGGDSEVVIEDANLLALLNAELGKGANEALTERELRSFTSLSLDAANISSLKGIENCTRLTSLELMNVNSSLNTDILSECTSLESVAIEPANASQLSFLRNMTLEEAVIYNFTFTDFLRTDSMDRLVIDGGSNADLSLFANADANEIEVINQQIEADLVHNGQVFTYLNQLKDINGNFISLEDVVVTADGQSAVSVYESSARTLTIQAAADSEVEIEVDQTFRGKVSRYTAVLQAEVQNESAIDADLSQSGWQLINGTWVYVENNALTTGWKQINGTWYYFKDNGAMATGWFMDEKMCWYFLDYQSGAMKVGWAADGANWYYLNPANGIMQTGWLNINGQTYYCLTSGVNAGAMVTGYADIDGVTYEFDSSGVYLREVGPAENPQEPQEPQEPETPTSPESPEEPEGPSHPDEPTETVKNWWVEESDGWTFYQNNVPVENIWVADHNNDWFYAGANGKMLVSSWIARDASGEIWYYVDAEGKMVTNTVVDGYTIDANGEWHAYE